MPDRIIKVARKFLENVAKFGYLGAADIRIKLRNDGWAGHVARMGEKRGAYRIVVGRPEGRRSLGDPGIDGRIILKRVLKKWDGAWTGLSWLRIGTGDGLL
jgi:hypothetical protein